MARRGSQCRLKALATYIDVSKRNIPRPRNGGSWSESEYWAAVRSALRHKFRYWKPMQQKKLEARRKSQSDNKRLKWEYQCADCKGWYAGKEVQIDHIVECGSLKCADDLAGFLERLTPEDPDAFQVLCKPCHHKRTQAYRARLRASEK